MSRDRAAYMREYRAKKARPMTDHEMAMALTSKPGWTLVADEHLALLQREGADLQAEVARLKRELAARPDAYDKVTAHLEPLRADLEDAFRQFRPVPKPGRK